MLPPEIIIRILEKVYYKINGNVDYATLCKCSLICRDWHDVVQSLLVKRVVLRKDVPTHLLQYGDSIRVLVVQVGEGHFDISPSAFASIFGSCPRLYELDLTLLNSLDRFDEDIMQSLSVSPPPFKALRLNGMEWESTVPFQLLGLTSSVRHLSIASHWVATPPSEPIKHKLYELRIFGALSGEILSWLISRSVGSLQIVESREYKESRKWRTQSIKATLCTILHDCVPYIRSLRGYFDSDLEELIACCTNLEELVLYLYDLDSLPSLPISITHLVLVKFPSLYEPLSYDALLPRIRNHPNLRLLTCDKRFACDINFPKWKAKCAKRNIDVVWYEYGYDVS
jgi:hypothetical protein